MLQSSKTHPDSTEMAGLFASMAVKWAIDKLSSLLTPVRQTPVASSSSSSSSCQGLDDLRMLERTMRRIHATLMDAEEHWNIREESAKLRLRELKELAYGAEHVVEEYEYEVNRCRLEAADSCASNCSKRKRHEVEFNSIYLLCLTFVILYYDSRDCKKIH